MHRLIFKILVLCFLGLFLLSVIGCDGISGPRGKRGPIGEDGPPYEPSVPENRYFSLAVANNSLIDHNGAPKVYLAFDDKHLNAGDTVVSQRLPEGKTPQVDGIDGGVDEWGSLFSNIQLIKAAGANNFIETIQVRSAWDEENVYFQLKWTEVEDAELNLSVSESKDPRRLIFAPENAVNWYFSDESEDRVFLMFPINEIQRFENDGCFVSCHAGQEEANYHGTNNPRERIDMWAWSAAITNPTGYARDLWADNTPNIGTRVDLGIPLSRLNYTARFGIEDGDADTLYINPIYQHVNDPNYEAPYPLWDWETASYDSLNKANFDSAASIPSIVSGYPTGSAADVVSFGTFTDGTWTVEFKRQRKTGNGDDVKF